MSNESRDSAIRETKRYVREVVRNDWVFEPSSPSPSGLRPSSSTPPIPEQEVSEWRLREYDDSDSELEPASSPELEPIDAGEEYFGKRGLDRDDTRRRKRRKQMLEEMRWNEGLRTWVERRDAWSGAQTRHEVRLKERRRKEAQASYERSCGDDEHQTTADAAAQGTSTSTTASAANEDGEALAARTEAALSIADKVGAELPDQPLSPGRELGEGQSTPADQPVDGETKGKESAEAALTEPDATSKPASLPLAPTSQLPEASEDPLIPVVPSLICSTNPIRASITTSMYPSIYSKVVVQGLTPTVPINLADVTKAMVQGWKADGQWPPKPANTNLVLADTSTVPKKDNEANGHSHERRKSGVASAVRKVFHFSGFHPHPFHRRGSTSQGNANQEHDHVPDAGPSQAER